MNLLYIRAAIREATGVVMSQEDILTLLYEEGMITEAQSRDRSLVFRGYGEFFSTDYAFKQVESLPDCLAATGTVLQEEDI